MTLAYEVEFRQLRCEPTRRVQPNLWSKIRTTLFIYMVANNGYHKLITWMVPIQTMELKIIWLVGNQRSPLNYQPSSPLFSFAFYYNSK